MGVVIEVVDSVYGVPARGVPVRLEQLDGVKWVELHTGETGPAGKVRDLWQAPLRPGVYQVRLDTDCYFSVTGMNPAYPEITTALRVASADEVLHIQVLLSPWSYSVLLRHG